MPCCPCADHLENCFFHCSMCFLNPLEVIRLGFKYLLCWAIPQFFGGLKCLHALVTWQPFNLPRLPSAAVCGDGSLLFAIQYSIFSYVPCVSYIIICLMSNFLLTFSVIILSFCLLVWILIQIISMGLIFRAYLWFCCLIFRYRPYSAYWYYALRITVTTPAGIVRPSYRNLSLKLQPLLSGLTPLFKTPCPSFWLSEGD